MVNRLFGAIDRRFFRFLVVGVLNTAFGYLMYALLLRFGLHYTAALLLATIAGVLFNFRTTGRLVFGNRDNSLLWRFIGVYALQYLLSIGVLRLLHEAGLNDYLAGAVLMLPMAVLSFILNRALVFSAGRQ